MKRTLILLAALAAVVAAAGAFNYQRNLAREEEQLRPYRGYTDANLETLFVAYRDEVEKLGAAYAAARSRRLEVRGDGLLDEQVRRFEQTQRASARTRDLGARLSVREADLREIEREQALRAAERDRLRVFLRRLLGVD